MRWCGRCALLLVHASVRPRKFTPVTPNFNTLQLPNFNCTALHSQSSLIANFVWAPFVYRLHSVLSWRAVLQAEHPAPFCVVLSCAMQLQEAKVAGGPAAAKEEAAARGDDQPLTTQEPPPNMAGLSLGDKA